MTWKPEWTVALAPPVGALLVSVVLVIAGQSAATAQWGAIITFVVLLPFSIGRLLDKGR